MAADSVTPWRWYWMCVAGWTMMVGAWMAAGDVMGMPEFLLGCAVVLVASFPISYYAALGPAALRSVTNLIAVSGALAFGLLGLPHIWLPLFNEAGASLGAAYRLLIALFTWVMVWRAAALREPSDVLQTTLPVGSVLLLALVSDPGVLTAAGACVALLGT
ncbi:MAG: hypothetical protein H5T86_06125, partial [Armatimonadetes bacterium]|nr:hypothetical protein [Armatimonadota bacterium]